MNSDRQRKRGQAKDDKQAKNTRTAGAQEIPRLYPAGGRLSKPGRNLATAHAPRVGTGSSVGTGIPMVDAVKPTSANGDRAR